MKETKKVRPEKLKNDIRHQSEVKNNQVSLDTSTITKCSAEKDFNE